MRTVLTFLFIWAVFATVLAAYSIQSNHELEDKVKRLELDVRAYSSSRENLLKKNDELWDTINKLKEENRHLRSEVQKLRQEKRELEQEIQRLRDKIATLNRIIDEFKKVPKGYYSADFLPEHKNTVRELRNFLRYEFRLPHKYDDGVFDCSEIAAYTEWALEDAGFDAYIAEGYKGAIGHAWVVVKVAGTTYYIDPTIMRKDDDRTILISPSDYRIKPSAIYSNIYEAIERDKSVEEWDWWTVTGFPPKVGG